MKIGQLATKSKNLMIALALIGSSPWGALAQEGHSHGATTQSQQLTTAQGALLKIVRENTERFKDVSVSEREGYSLLFGCVSGPDAGAMGLHFVNLPLVAAGVIDATRPQIVIYEPMADGPPATDRGRLSGYRERLGQGSSGTTATAHGTALSLFREPQSFWTPRVLHTSRVGVERESQRRVRELASKRFLPVLCGPIARANKTAFLAGDCHDRRMRTNECECIRDLEKEKT